jgi:two-component system sensor kinase FixL
MGRQGTLAIEVRQQGDQAIVEITDSGSGIAVEMQSKIFEPFVKTK